MLVLGIESSCDETGAALISDKDGLLADALYSQIDMHRAYGGVVPELASRDHIRRAVALVDEVLVKAGKTRGDIDAVAVTEGPGLAGALLAGAGVAHAIGWALARALRTPSAGRSMCPCSACTTSRGTCLQPVFRIPLPNSRFLLFSSRAAIPRS